MTTTIKYSTTALLALALLMSAVPAYAEESNTGVRTTASVNVRADVQLTPQEREERREKVREERMENIETRQEMRVEASANVEARRAELKARGIENAQERIAHNLKRFMSLLEAGAERLEGIIVRIEARAEVLAEAGADTSEVSAHIAVAETAIADMYIKLGDIKGEAAAVTADNAREVFQKIRAELIEAKELLQDAGASVLLIG